METKGIVVSRKAKERQQYEVGYMDDNKLIGIDENIEDCIVLDKKMKRVLFGSK